MEDRPSITAREQHSNTSTANGTNQKSRVQRPDDRQRRSQTRINANQLSNAKKQDGKSLQELDDSGSKRGRAYQTQQDWTTPPMEAAQASALAGADDPHLLGNVRRAETGGDSAGGPLTKATEQSV